MVPDEGVEACYENGVIDVSKAVLRLRRRSLVTLRAVLLVNFMFCKDRKKEKRRHELCIMNCR